MIVDPKQLTQESLFGIIDNFILREGTDYGMHEVTHLQKRESLMTQISEGAVLIVFDAESESVTLLAQEEYASRRME
jgi:uncharacterized protein YheU (UPF0270 family)